jgi:carboxypeptidase C (cathepsin A)
MKTFLATCAATLLLLTTSTIAQESSKDAKPPAAAADAKTPDANPPKEESWPSDHTIKINNQSIAYKATASTTLLKDEKGEPTALIYSTAYTRSDSKDFSRRPIAFIYNGGPGSASIWLHMGAFGPRRVVNADHARPLQNRRQREFPAR